VEERTVESATSDNGTSFGPSRAEATTAAADHSTQGARRGSKGET